MEVPAMAKEASVTRELYRENSTSRDPGTSVYKDKDFTPSRENTQPLPPPRYKRWASSVSLAQPSSSSSYLPDWVASSSSRFSKATSSLYQKSRGALGILRSSSLFDLRGSTTDLRGSTTDLRGSTADLRGSTSNLRGSTSNLRGSISNIRELRNSRQDLTAASAPPQSQRDKARRQTTQVSELDLSRARSWQGSTRELQDGGEGEKGWELGRRGSLLGRTRSNMDLGYSSPGTSRRTSCGRDSEEREEEGHRDYKKLWEESQAENARLRLEMAEIREELEDTRRRLEEALMGAVEREDFRERLEMEERVKRMEGEIQDLRTLKDENEELRTQNNSLSRAISKMSAAVRKTTRV